MYARSAGASRISGSIGRSATLARAIASAAAVTLVVWGFVGCNSDGDGPSAKAGVADRASGSSALRYERIALTPEQSDALRTHAHSLMTEGRVPSEVGMLVSPQPQGVGANEVVVAVEWGSCGGVEPLEAHLEEGMLVIEVVDPKRDSDSVCAGLGMRSGLRVELPEGMTAKEVEGVIVKHRPSGY